MELWTTEGIITGAAWTTVIVAAVAYLPFWHLLVAILISVNILLFVLITYTFKKTNFRHSQILFDIIWSPFVAKFSYSGIRFTEPNFKGEQKLLPFERGIPPWMRRQAFIISVIALNSETSADIILYISWVIFFNSLLSIVKEMFGTGDCKGTNFNRTLEYEISIPRNFMNEYFEDFDFNTRMSFWTVHTAICILCIAYNCLATTLTYVFVTILFSCSGHTQIQLQVMTKFRLAYPYIMDGLGEVTVLGILIVMDILISASLFLSAFNSDSSLVLVCMTYCNTFAAVMEFHVRVWLPLRNERFLIKRMRSATKEELMAHNDVCAICLVNMTYARVTVCQHIFHGKCLRLSLKNNAQCPMCKSALVPTFGHANALL